MGHLPTVVFSGLAGVLSTSAGAGRWAVVSHHQVTGFPARPSAKIGFRRQRFRPVAVPMIGFGPLWDSDDRSLFAFRERACTRRCPTNVCYPGAEGFCDVNVGSHGRCNT